MDADQQEEEGSSPRTRCYVFSVAAVIALCWALSVFTTKRLQGECGFSKPLLITYLHELAIAVICLPLALLSRTSAHDSDTGCRAHSRRVLQAGKRLACRAAGLGLLAFVANCCFTAALGYTEASTAMTLEQFTSVFIAVLGFLLLGESYRRAQLLGLALAVCGGVLHAQAGATGSSRAPDPALGNCLVLVTCAAAATYMVLFKKAFEAEPFDLCLLYAFFVAKGLFVASVGWLPVLIAEDFAMPDGTCGRSYLLVNMVFQVGFNVGLAWATVVVSPLAARLFILLGLPLAFAIDLVEEVRIGPLRVLGVALAVAGVAIFELASSPPPGAGARRRGGASEDEVDSHLESCALADAESASSVSSSNL
eukprot:TRINITY_DN28751_c0_g1_i1.p1 TRINITY_DN28751_c0_g1~~TRINITY_DN28751_c0_g1_i1.p1  ORF type:complete len:374 (+),score=81.85 TRINITY_DN28751_c0_g1_i1:27-1124(+)